MLLYHNASQRCHVPKAACDHDVTGCGKTSGQHSRTPSTSLPTIGISTNTMRHISTTARIKVMSERGMRRGVTCEDDACCVMRVKRSAINHALTIVAAIH